MHELGLYIHIPFCSSKCHYCAFAVTTDTSNQDAYVSKLLLDITRAAEYAGKDYQDLTTISLGGGTPSKLTLAQISSIMDACDQAFHTHALVERSIECNPEDLTPSYLEGLITRSFHRISVGVQTCSDTLLQKIGRSHTHADTTRALSLLQHQSLNWSADLILGLPFSLPGQTKEDLFEVLSYTPPHISLYFYTQEPRSTFATLSPTEIPSEHHILNEYATCSDILRKAGYRQYEYSNWARDGYISQHNLQYWNNAPYIGVGLGAYSYMHNTSLHAPINLSKWLTHPNFFLEESMQQLSPKEQVIRMLMMGLRRDTGVAMDPIQDLLSDSELIGLSSVLSSPEWQPYLISTYPQLILNPEGRNLHSRFIADIYDHLG